jgi:SAM-dependent methyltransferase
MSTSALDIVRHREWLTSLVKWPATGAVVDLGCGSGDDLVALASRAPAGEVRLLGVDRDIIEAQECPHPPNVTFERGDLTTGLPWPDQSFDIVFSHNYLECVSDVPSFVNDVARVLRPGGQVVFGHWDWDTQTFNDSDKDRVRRLVHAFADWQQPRMDHADGWMGRRLWGAFESTGLFQGVVHARTMINTEYAPPWYGHARAQDFRALVKRNLATAEDVDGFLAEQETLATARRYCYSITGYAYVGRCNHD